MQDISEAKKEEKTTFSEIVVQFEKDLLDPKNDRFNTTIEVVDRLKEHCKSSGLLSSGHNIALVEHWYTRLAVAISSWAVDPGEALNAQKLEALVRRKNEFVYIFAASGFRNMTHLISQLDTANEKGKFRIAGQKIIVLLGLLGLDDLNEELINLALGTAPNVRLHLVLGWLNQRAVMSARGEANRAALLASGPQLTSATITDADIPLIVNAYMYTSYAAYPNKHAIKKSFNQLLVGRMAQAEVCEPSVSLTKTSRPRVLLPLERFRHQHAMFRSFGPAIRGMKERFELIALVEDDNIDSEAEAIFDEVHMLKRAGQKSVKAIVKLIESIEPDVVFYPSLGMSHWTVMLSNLRLAPIQVIGQGHPATSYSSEIDYVIVPEMWGNPAALYSECILMFDSPVVFDMHSDLPETLPPALEPSEREVRVAVNSKVMKLSHRLLDICERLQSVSSIPVRFRFFPGELGWYADGVSAMIKQRLPGAEVYPYEDYPTFIGRLAECDLALAAFPFGNTNSTVDTCVLGIPTIAHFGPEASSQTDRKVLEAAGCPPSLICETDDAYFEAALELIENAEKRKSVSGLLRSNDVVSRLTVPFSCNNQTQISELIAHAYRHHGSIKAAGTRLIKWAEIAKNNDTRH